MTITVEDIKKNPALLTADPNISIFIKPEFLSKSHQEKQELYSSIPFLSQIGISLETMETISRDFYNISRENIEKFLEKKIGALIDNQNGDGSFSIADPAYLRYLRSYLSEEIDAYVTRYGHTAVPTPWTNSLIIILLTKWLVYVQKRKIINEGSIKKIENAIQKSRDWLQEIALEKQNEEGLSGWPFIIGSRNKVSSSETSLALIALNYDVGFGFEVSNRSRIFVGEKYLDSLLSKQLSDENGRWRVEEEQEEFDSASTSYAILCLMKYHEVSKDEKIKSNMSPKIKKGVDWLLDNQRDDGGWGDIEKLESKKSYIEKTAFALMALSKYLGMFKEDEQRIIRPLKLGMLFLQLRFNKCPDLPEEYGWPNDYTTELRPSIKFSSLVISTLLRCGVPSYDTMITQGIIGLFKMCPGPGQKQEDFVRSESLIYFYCMLADYLKAIP